MWSICAASSSGSCDLSLDTDLEGPLGPEDSPRTLSKTRTYADAWFASLRV